MKRIFFLIFLPLVTLLSQSSDSSYSLESFTEDKLIADQEEEDSGITEYLDELISNPVNINTADADQLSVIPFLAPADAVNIISHRNDHGYFFSRAELYSIKELPEEKIKAIMPFIKLEEEFNPGLFSDYKISLRSRFRKKDINDNSRYLWGNYNRIKFDSDNLSAGLLTEKDEGEKSITDLLTGYIKLIDSFSFKTIILGDYIFENGQGLLFWSSYGMPKNADVINSVYKRGRGLKANTGSSEMSFFRGAAFERSLGNVLLSGFWSGTHRDASTDSIKIIKLLKDGYHVSDLELSRKNSVYENFFGGSIKYSTDVFESSLTGFTAGFSKQYHSGSNNVKGFSLSSRFIIDDVLFFGEAARTENSNAVIAGINIMPVKNVEFTSAFRRYEPDYMNLYGFGFGERNGAVKNETGIYSGISLHTAIGSFSCYLDQYSFIAPSENIHNTLSGYDILFYASIPINKRVHLNARYKSEKKDQLLSSQNSRTIQNIGKQNLRADVNYKAVSFSLKTRGEYTYAGSGGSGYLFMNELKHSISKPVAVIFRIIFFRTDSFNSALYTYESGIPGIIENKVLSGEGIRLYTVLKITVKNFPALYIKYGNTIKQELNTSANSSIIIQTEMILLLENDFYTRK
jgi:hypothetical protein